MQKIDLTHFNSLVSLFSHFKNDEICRNFLKEQRWADGDVICPYCGEHHCYSRTDGKFRCPHCLNNFSVLKGTIFENTKISLVKWFAVMYMISSHKKGISSHQIARDCEITQKTAWYILHKVRTLYVQEVDAVLQNDVELDETYIGGREKNKHENKKTENTQGRSTKTKTPVFGLVERGGKLIAQKVANTSGTVLSPIIRQFVKAGSRIFTDEWIGYNSLRESEYTHSVVHHHQKEFVVGDAYTNTVEGFWGQLKRMILGIYHFVSSKHLQRYVDEAVFRFNTRNDEESVRFGNMFARSLCPVRYAQIKNSAF